MTNATTHMMDYNMTEHWCKAVSPSTPVAYPTAVFESAGNVYQFAVKHDVWFTPDYDADGVLIHNERLESFRLACLYDAMSNMLDIGINLDDDATNSTAFYERLTANDHNDRNEPSWLTTPAPYHITYRTYRPRV